MYSISIIIRSFRTQLYKLLLSLFTCRFQCNESSSSKELTDDMTLKTACKFLEEGYRLTLWAYDATHSTTVSIRIHYVHALFTPWGRPHVYGCPGDTCNCGRLTFG